MMFARSVTPAKAGAYTHIGSQGETRAAVNADRSERMGPGLRRDDGIVRYNRLRAFAPSRELKLFFCLTRRREGAKGEASSWA